MGIVLADITPIPAKARGHSFDAVVASQFLVRSFQFWAIASTHDVFTAPPFPRRRETASFTHQFQMYEPISQHEFPDLVANLERHQQKGRT